LGNPNGAYLFNGTSSYIQIPNNATLCPQQMTLFAWVKPMGFYNGLCYNNCIIDKGQADYLTGDYSLRFTQAAWTGADCNNPDILHQNFVGYSNTNGSPPLYTPYVTPGTWYPVVYTVSADSVKLYVNCSLVWKAPKLSPIGTNTEDLFFGKKNYTPFPYWFNGVIDEIRIYDRPINQEEVEVLGDCRPSISNVINQYTPVLGFDPCENKIIVEDATAFGAGDTVLMIQMKGAVIDSTNTSAFGTISNYKNSGNYEFNFVKSKSGNVIELKNYLTRQYDIPVGKVQLVRVPYYQNVSVSGTLTCLPWDGSKGGVLAMIVQDTISLSADIDVSGKGFMGGIGFNPQNNTLTCFENNYNYPIASNSIAAQKGESITTISQTIICGKGSPAGGGGGGLGHNSGGGGGANGGSGGFGGYQLNNCGSSPFDNRGVGGHPLTYNSVTNKVFMGSGGGAGQMDNIGTPPMSGGNGGGMILLISNKLIANSHKILANGSNATSCIIAGPSNCHDAMGGGGAGGSILISTNTILDNTAVETKGGKGGDMIGDVPLGGRIGAGGGGGGGLFFTNSPSIPANITYTTTGGANGVLTQDANNPWGATAGQNGVSLVSLNVPFDLIPFKPNIDSVRIQASSPSCNNYNLNGLGYTNTNPVSTWQWFFGDGGSASTQNTSHAYSNAGVFTIKLVITDINGCKDSITRNVTAVASPIVSTIADPTICAGSPVTLTTTGALTYSWSPAPGLSNPSISSPVATPSVTTQYFVTGTDANGCSGKDTVTVNVNPKPVITKSPNVSICQNTSTQLSASGGVTYSWSPAATLDNGSIPNPTASPTGPTTYYVNVTDSNGCMNNDSIKVTIVPPAVFSINAAPAMCENKTSQLQASGGHTYSWQPAASLNNPSIPNPVATPQTTTNYDVLITDTVCHISSTLSTTVNVLPLPDIQAARSNDIDCSNDQSQLSATGGLQYQWSPGSTLNQTNIRNPIAMPQAPTTYTVTGTDAAGCQNTDTVTVNILVANPGAFLMPTAFTPNGDQLNDCYGIRYWGAISGLEFSIYNRWGERIFYTSNPASCWDGKYKGVDQNADVFVYMIKAKSACAEKPIFRKGTFALIR
ncbi:MAG TPA: LamG-like jellyroll fold domain-containing protein, partial [Chitinophagaceae bacterium]|nr:LamG-like jellyroll fold domain-containing protein [Chitinophagaceae bacterium]